MNEITGIVNFTKPNRQSSAREYLENYFRGPSVHNLTFGYGEVSFQEQDKFSSYYKEDSKHVFIFGTVYSNNLYTFKIEKGRTRVLRPEDVLGLNNKFGHGLTEYIKGNFVICLYEEDIGSITLISSRHNSLPLYYWHKEGNFIFSSSLRSIIKLIDYHPGVNTQALVEQLIFFYPLRDRTYFNDIFQLEPSTILSVNKSSIKFKKYWNTEELFKAKKILSEKESLDRCLYIMEDNLRLYTSDTDKFLLALTGGFDSRTNLSLLKRNPADFLCYSYGLPGSSQIQVPLRFINKTKFNYMPVYLDKKFIDTYETSALRALDWSDGSAPIIRANFPFVFDLLKDFAKINIVGLFGSEVIKSFRGPSEIISAETINLFFCRNPKKLFSDITLDNCIAGYLKKEVFNSAIRQVEQSFSEDYLLKDTLSDRTVRFYNFFLKESCRKYFMQETRIERFFVQTRMPYSDDEFLEIIFQTPFSGMYRKSWLAHQILYAKIINSSNPQLGTFLTDRGYSPKTLLLPFPLRIIQILLPCAFVKMKKIVRGNDTFNSLFWSKGIVEKYINEVGREDDIFTDKLIVDFKNKAYRKNPFRFFSIFSLRLWLYLNQLS